MGPTLAAIALLLGPQVPREAPPEPQVTVAERPALALRLKSDPFFSKLPLRAVASFPPIDLVLQEPYGSRPGWEAMPSNRFGPWAREVVNQFDERFAGPLALERAKGFGPPAMVVLASEGDLLNLRRSPTGRRSTAYSEANYLHDFDAVVVSATSSQQAPHLARFPGLMLLVYRELLAHGEDGARPPFWILWGVPAYLAWSTGFGPDALKTREIDYSVLMDWFASVSRTEDGDLRLMPILGLVDAADEAAAKAAMRPNALRMGGGPDDDLGHMLWCACVLWVHYLQDGDGGRWRDGFGAYLAGTLRGRRGAAAFREAMQLDDAGLAALDRGFDAWVLATAMERGVVTLEGGPRPSTEPEPAEAAPELPPLAPQPDEVALGHGLALVQARDGDLDGALARLEALLTADPEGAYAQRIARDLERARGFRELRAALLARLAESGDLLKLERDGKRLNVRVASVDATGITLRESRGGLDAIPFGELSSFQLAREMDRDAGWLRLWPYALVDDERWQRLLDEDEPGARELREDAAEWYPGALRLGEVARELAALGDGSLPDTSAEATALAERAGALWREHGTLPEVESRRAALRARVAQVLEFAWEPELLGRGLGGTLEHLGGGRARLTLDFEDEGQLEDLRVEALYPADRFAETVSLNQSPDFRVARGRLRAVGGHTWRLPLVFRAPLSVRYSVRVGTVPDGGNSVVLWAIGACDDGRGNLVMLESLGTLMVIDRPANHAAQALTPAFQTLRGTPYAIELRHDGESLHSLVDGEEVKSLAAPTRLEGDVLFTALSDAPLEFDDLVVEGELDGAANRARWIERELAALGL